MVGVLFRVTKFADGFLARTLLPRSSRAVAALAALAAFSIVWWWFALHVPYNMDEAIHYQPVACTAFPFARFHEFREACGHKDLFLFTWLPLRAFYYVGALSNIGFFPFWALIGTPLSLRVFSFVLALGSLFLLARLARLPAWLAIFALGLFPPFLLQHVVDTGPIAWQIFWGLAGTILLVEGLEDVASERGRGAIRVALRGVWRPLLAGTCYFLVLEQKLFGVFFFPFLGGVVLLRWRDELPRASTHLRGFLLRRPYGLGTLTLGACGLVGVAMTGLLTKGLLSLSTRKGATYGEEVLRQSNRLTPEEWMLHAEKGFRFLTTYFSQWEQYLHRVYSFRAGDWFGLPPPLSEQWAFVKADPLPHWPLALLALLPLACVFFRRGTLAWCLTFLTMGAAMLLLVVNVRQSWAGHHVIVSHLFFALAVAIIVIRVPGWKAATVCTIVGFANLAAYARAAGLEPSRILWPSSPSRMELFEVVDRPGFASTHYLVHVNWGTYYLDALFGPREQLVTYIEPFTGDREFDEVSAKAKALGRTLALYAHTNETPEWRSFLARKSFVELAVSSDGVWRIWVQR